MADSPFRRDWGTDAEASRLDSRGPARPLPQPSNPDTVNSEVQTVNSQRCRLPQAGGRRHAPSPQASDQCGASPFPPPAGAPVTQTPAMAVATAASGAYVVPGSAAGCGRSTGRIRVIVVLLAGIVLFTLTAASCGGQKRIVSVGTASVGTVAEEVEAPATVTAAAAVAVTAPAEGSLATLYVGTGDTVKTGQILAVIDSPAAEERLAQSEAALDAANRATVGYGGGTDLSDRQRATDRAAARAFDDARDAGKRIADPPARDALLAQVRAAQQQYEATARSARNAVRSVQRGMARLSSAMRALSAAQRLQAQQAYDLARSTVDALKLRAPIAGAVQLGAPASTPALAGVAGSGTPGGQLSSAAGPPTGGTPVGSVPGVDGIIPVGGRVAAGTPVLTVVDTAHVGVVADVDQTDVLLVRPGISASIELDAAAGARYSGKVRSVDVLPAPSARGGVSYRVRLTLGTGALGDGRDAPRPRPGMSGTATLQVRQARDAVTVPAATVFSAEGGNAVWVVRDGRAERITVTVGVQGKDAVQIVSGVRPGQQVVVRGTDQVQQGEHLP
jgi:HlyD family secretion protein